jgi:hypothetical protein
MKHLNGVFFVFSIWLVSHSGPRCLYAQEVISSAGTFATATSGSLSFTVGEPAIATYAAAGYILTQGFQQVFMDSLPGPVLNKLYVKAFLQGPYTGASAMAADLSQLGYLPLSQPYNVNPWFYNGGESVSSIPQGAVDWVLVELRSHVDTIVARKAALLYSNGSIYDTSLTLGIEFDSLSPGAYYLVIDHRNHFPVMSANKIPVPDASLKDFSNSAAFPPYGGTGAAIALGNGVSGLVAGDINKDRLLKYSGPGNDRALILQRIITLTGSNSIITTINGYFNEDLSLNGNLKYSGPGNDASRIIQNLVTLTGSSAINTTLTSPVPAGVNKK